MWSGVYNNWMQNNMFTIVWWAVNRKGKLVNYWNVKTPKSGTWFSMVKQAQQKHVVRLAGGVGGECDTVTNAMRNSNLSLEARLFSALKLGWDSETPAPVWTVRRVERKSSKWDYTLKSRLNWWGGLLCFSGIHYLKVGLFEMMGLL